MSLPPPAVWVVLPTYNEADNVRPMTAGILQALPAATVLVVDDGSPDGTGRIADELAAADPRIRVRHRTAKQGLGRAYLDGFGVALDSGATVVVQMDADFSHDPAVLPTSVGPIEGDEADLVIGSRYMPGGGVVDVGLGALARRVELAPQAARVRVEGPRAPEAPESPHIAEQLVLAKHALRLGSEGQQEVVLLRGQEDRALRDTNRA